MANKDFLVKFKADTNNYDANIAKAQKTLKNFAKENLSAGGAMRQVTSSLVATAARFASVTAAIGAFGAAMKSNIETARRFEVSVSQLSSLTGMVGQDLNTLKEYAIELGSTTTLSASQVADAFKLIGSQQPQLLSSAEALKEVTKNAITLSEAAGIDLATASQTLSTSINQMGGDSSNAARFINVLAAASQKGAGDIAWLGEAITKSGTTAKMVGTSYEELVANLEQLAQAGFDASTAGTALRSIIINLEKQSNDQLKPSVVGLTTAMENLGKQNLSVGELAGVVGKMFSGQAQTLADNAEKARELQQAITGTNTAEEQAKTNTDNLHGSLLSLSSAWEGLNLHINDSNGFLRDCVNWLKDVVTWADQAFTKAGRASKALADAQKSPVEGKSQIDLKIEALSALPKERQAEQQAIDIYQLQQKLDKKRQEYADWDPLIPWETPRNAKKREAYMNDIKAIESMLSEYRKRSNAILNPAVVVEEEVNPTGGTGGDTTKTTSGDTTKTTTQKRIAPLDVKDISGLSIGTTQSMKELQAKLREYQQMLANATDRFVAGAAQQGIETTQRLINAQPLAAKMGITAEDAADLQEKVKSLKDIVQEGLENDPVILKAKMESEDGGLNELGKDANLAGKAFNSAAQSVSNLAQAMAALEDPGAKAAGTVMQAIASIALGFGAAVAQAGSMGPWAWLAYLGAGTAALATTISTVHSLTGYEQGGVVKGSSYSGDNVGGMVDGSQLVGLNAGEVVLTRAMVGNLASQLTENRGSGGRSYRPYVTGDKLFLGLNNWGKETGRGHLVFSKD